MSKKRWAFDGRTVAGIQGITRWEKLVEWLMDYPEVITDPYYAELREALIKKRAQLKQRETQQRRENRWLRKQSRESQSGGTSPGGPSAIDRLSRIIQYAKR